MMCNVKIGRKRLWREKRGVLDLWLAFLLGLSGGRSGVLRLRTAASFGTGLSL